MVEKESGKPEPSAEEEEEEDAMSMEETGPPKGGRLGQLFSAPILWLRMLSDEMHWSFVLGVVFVYGINQGLGGALAKVGTEYYMKDVQKVQPSEAQIYSGITSIPWIIKPIWGLLTDVVPISGYRRRPYFILAGSLGVLSMLLLSHYKVHLVLALALLTAGSTGVAIADVTIDACVAQNSIAHPSLAADMQSLCALSSSVGALVGFFISGILVHLIGPMGVYGFLVIPYLLVLSVGITLNEPHVGNFDYQQINRNFLDAGKAMLTTLKCPSVWRPCIYMYSSLALSLNIFEGMFYWYTDAKGGPNFSQETVGYLFSIGSIGALLGALLYQHSLKDHPFRDLLLWTQLFYGVLGMLDLILVVRINTKFGIPDQYFAVIDECVSQMIGRLKWMPLLVLSSKLCPPGIEGTFFALLMSIDNMGLLSSSWGGGLLLHILGVTRTRFTNLWLAILVRNLLRVSPLCLLFLVPRADPSSSILPDGMLSASEETGDGKLEAEENIELVSLVSRVDRS
ncbi:probable folate-biopterin transporter 2 [Punica granatum]|uniref:Uncharacterized protein n=2 Tax=Punica granatum TaxID=22663 RepID=A0A218WAT1_PUNGR|nr:probable folate-biopterin transporter 2 [Punica granatum]OWM69895.1 hypothetical protein CDL15_Pgr025744 [Punica granatum]PKI40613.1 hypothetical protein CRG98_039023 [Punica granatum]